MVHSQKQINYLKKWKTIREYKLRYYLKHALLYWSLPMSIMFILFRLWDVRFSLKQDMIFEFIAYFLLLSVFGVFSAHSQFKGQEKLFREVNNKGLLE